MSSRLQHKTRQLNVDPQTAYIRGFLPLRTKIKTWFYLVVGSVDNRYERTGELHSGGLSCAC